MSNFKYIISTLVFLKYYLRFKKFHSKCITLISKKFTGKLKMYFDACFLSLTDINTGLVAPRLRTHNQNITVAPRLQSLILPNMRSIRLRRL